MLKETKDSYEGMLECAISWLEDIEEMCAKLTSGNVSHQGASIRGKAMNHCVATYFGKKNSLILSVRLADSGKRLATVELSMKDFSIKQCRANSNKQPERYAEICSVINAHRGDFCKSPLQTGTERKIWHKTFNDTIKINHNEEKSLCSQQLAERAPAVARERTANIGI